MQESASRALVRIQHAHAQGGRPCGFFRCRTGPSFDIWQYLYLDDIPIVPLYFAAEPVHHQRDGTLIMVDDDRLPLRAGEKPMLKKVPLFARSAATH